MVTLAVVRSHLFGPIPSTSELLPLEQANRLRWLSLCEPILRHHIPILSL
jgi:hypothetical protein